ncbi:UNKNOWN [Stylonychia lemnae]|uniref:Uncharacterized protein n=1 Tax=Stylonychia lemnae TaxID=5949 RepID=A0A078A852_STYLE|nr:UNKNOWN [Stylonychia lemnae]|eukprot:CDW76956.1 UNKNOWN [Stylonychia lemnae]
MDQYQASSDENFINISKRDYENQKSVLTNDNKKVEIIDATNFKQNQQVNLEQEKCHDETDKVTQDDDQDFLSPFVRQYSRKEDNEKKIINTQNCIRLSNLSKREVLLNRNQHIIDRIFYRRDPLVNLQVEQELLANLKKLKKDLLVEIQITDQDQIYSIQKKGFLNWEKEAYVKLNSNQIDKKVQKTIHKQVKVKVNQQKESQNKAYRWLYKVFQSDSNYATRTRKKDDFTDCDEITTELIQSFYKKCVEAGSFGQKMVLSQYVYKYDKKTQQKDHKEIEEKEAKQLGQLCYADADRSYI